MTWRMYGTSNYQIQYDIDTDCVIRVKNDSGLKTAVDLDEVGEIASMLKTLYKNYNGKSINITTRSIAFEILGHVYPDKAARNLKSLPFIPQKIKDTADSILKRTSVVDIGESSVDSNRWFWDTLDVIAELSFQLVIA